MNKKEKGLVCADYLAFDYINYFCSLADRFIRLVIVLVFNIAALTIVNSISYFSNDFKTVLVVIIYICHAIELIMITRGEE